MYSFFNRVWILNESSNFSLLLLLYLTIYGIIIYFFDSKCFWFGFCCSVFDASPRSSTLAVLDISAFQLVCLYISKHGYAHTILRKIGENLYLAKYSGNMLYPALVAVCSSPPSPLAFHTQAVSDGGITYAVGAYWASRCRIQILVWYASIPALLASFLSRAQNQTTTQTRSPWSNLRGVNRRSTCGHVCATPKYSHLPLVFGTSVND